MNKKSKVILWIVIGVVAVALISILMSDILGGAQELSFNEFMIKLKNGEINSLYVDAYSWTGKGANGSFVTTAPSIYNYADLMSLMNVLDTSANNIEIVFTDPNEGSIWSSILPFLGVALLALVFWFMMRSASGAGQVNMSINKNKAQVQNNLKVRFSDVAGAEEEKEELQEVVEFLKSPKKFSSLGARIPAGVLLVGPPGTGSLARESLMVRASASTIKPLPMDAISSSRRIRVHAWCSS